jgi:hypothetical protein
MVFLVEMGVLFVVCCLLFGNACCLVLCVHGPVAGYVQAVLTNGYICETLVAAVSISGRFLDLSSAAIGIGSDITNFLTLPSLDGGSVPVSCATNAATFLANFLSAIAHNQSVAAYETQSLLLQSIEKGLGGFVRRLLSGTAVGERRTVTAGAISVLSVSRTSLGSVMDQPFSLRLRIPGSPDAATLEFRLPASFGSDMFGKITPVVDMELSMHSIAPAAGNLTLVSGLSGLTVALPEIGTLDVQNLSLPVLITLPLTPPLPASSALMSKFECVFWEGWRFSSKGCHVEELVTQKLNVTAVVCSCTHLTMFAVSFAGDPPGSGVVPATSPFTTQAATEFNLDRTAAQSIGSIAGTVLVSFNAAGAFGLITSFQSLWQQRFAVRGVLTQSIYAALATATGHGESLAVIIIFICWGDQCLSFTGRQYSPSSSTAVPQMRIDFEVHCDTKEAVSLVSTNVVLDVFLLQVTLHMVEKAANVNLGNWSVVASMPNMNHPSSTNSSEFQGPNYNGSSPVGWNGSWDKDVVSENDSNLHIITVVIIGICVGISTIACCIFICILESRRKRSKLAPGEVLNHCSQSVVVNEESGENAAHSQALQGSTVQTVSQPWFILSRQPESTASNQDSELPVPVESRVQGRWQPPVGSLIFVHGFSNTGESEQQQRETPTLALGEVPAVEKQLGAGVQLRHARTMVVNLQRRLDHFIEEARLHDPEQTSLPGPTQAEDTMQSPLASHSSSQPIRGQQNQSNALFRRSAALEIPHSSTYPKNSFSGEPVGQNQDQLLISLPSPTDFTQQDALAPITCFHLFN